MLGPPTRTQARYQARLDGETSATLDALVRTFHHTRAAIVRSVIQWGLTHLEAWTVEVPTPLTVRTLSVLLDSERYAQVQAAVHAHGVTGAAWIRQALRQVTVEDFPAHWRTRAGVPRSHDSRVYGQRFMLRLDEATRQQLQRLVEQSGASRAEIIRQLIAHATPEACSKHTEPRPP